MEILQTKQTIMSFPEKRRAHVYVEESKTNYYVAFRPITPDCPRGWASWFTPIKVKKTRIVSSMLAAINAAYTEYMKNNIWNW